MKQFNNRSGFTLIELLIVIAVVGVLSAGVVTSINIVSKINSANLAKVETFDASVQNDLSINLVGEWKLDDTTTIPGPPVKVKDTSGYGNDGTVTGAALTTDRRGQAKKAYSFNGATRDSINLGTSSILNPGKEDFTYTFWASGTAASWAEILNKSDGDYSTVTAGFNITFRSGPPAYIFYTHTVNANQVNWSPITNMTDGTWHHWAFVGNRAAGNITLYKDGVSQGAKSPGGDFPNANITTGNKMNIGDKVPFWTGRTYTGSIDDVRIYKQALSFSSVQKLYAQGLFNRLLASNTLKL